MLLRKFTLIILLNALLIPALAQRSANWFFGFNAGIKFTPTGVVNQATSSILTDEGCSSLSDTAGNLLFYTDGITIWNKNHAVMTNGSGLQGNSSSSQSSIVVPMPGNPSLYYVFTATLPGTNRFYTYNIVDMSKQGGLGEVTTKNVILGNSGCSERITAMQHANKTDYWIITNPINTDSFKVYQLTAAGVNTTPVVSKLGRVTPGNFGMLKGSPDGKMIVHTVSNFNGFTDITQLFRFDDATGVLYNLVNIPFGKSYGCAFSPDSKRLYLNSSFPNTSGIPAAGTMVQYTVGVYDSARIAQSKYVFPISTQGGFGDLSVGPDSIMYLARHSVKRLSAIKRPNDSAAACQYVDTAIVLNGTSHYGLPNFYNNINVPPVVNISIAQLSCLQYRFSFNTNYNGTGIYTWTFGDGTGSSADSSPIHTFTRNGGDSFLIKFNFKSTDGSVDINVENWLKLPPKPVAAFTAQTNGCVEQAINFTNTSSTANGGIIYSWNFGDNTTSTLQSPPKIYTDTGRYTIRLSVSDAKGCLSDTVSTLVVVNKKIVVAFDITGPFCTASDLDMTGSMVSSATNAIIRYDMGSAIVTSNLPINKWSYATQGTYNIKMVATSTEGCVSDTARKTITVFSKPDAGYIMPQNCVTDLSAFTDTSTVETPSVINKWRWYFDDPAVTNDTSLVRNATYQYTSAANYNVRLIVATDKGCSDTAVKVFTVNGAVPKAALSFMQNPACGIDSIRLVNTSTVNFGSLISLNINWGNGTIADPNPPPGRIYKNAYPLFGTPATLAKPIRLTVQSGISCISVLDTFVTVRAQPRVQTQPILPVCSNASPVLLSFGSETMGAAGAGSYFGRGVSFDAATGTYQFNPSLASGSSAGIGYRFVTPGGCVDSATETITLLPKPSVNAGRDQTILFGAQATLGATASGPGLTYSWRPSMWLDNPAILRPKASPPRDTTYTLKVTTSDNCSDSSSVFIRVLQPIDPPNVITPNNDGVNDVWGIPELKTYSRPYVQIFTRWGQQVYQNVGYQKPWDGTMNGKPLPAGTYYYIILPGEGAKPVSGWVLVLK